MILNEEKEEQHYIAVKNLSEKVCKNKYFCGILMSLKKDKILEFKEYMKSDKMQYIIYADIEFLIIKIDGRKNNPKKISKTKIGEHIPCRYSISTIWGSITQKINILYIEGKDCVIKFCESLREHAKSIIDFKKKKMLLLTRKELKNICKIRFLKKSL